MQNAIEANHAELKMGQIAQKNAQSENIKKYGQKRRSLHRQPEGHRGGEIDDTECASLHERQRFGEIIKGSQAFRRGVLKCQVSLSPSWSALSNGRLPRQPASRLRFGLPKPGTLVGHDYLHQTMRRRHEADSK
ncbi:hypothetical protein [Bradyrhizobium sp.]|uniref:hypothetical protein n=1 Tax=Bradyrhizobium sp. TaxID=376 RepID=UPI003C4313C3